MKKFQIILLVVFGVGALIAVLVFAGYIPTPNRSQQSLGSGTVVVWGDITTSQFVGYMSELSEGIPNFRLTYVAKNPNTYETELIEAFAAGTGPDLFFVSNENVMRFTPQIEPVSYDILPQKAFQNTFAPAFGSLLTARGVLAYPFLIDPMVLYYNRTLLANDGIANPPTYWDELNELSEVLTKRDNTGNFLQSTIPFGRFENNKNAKPTIILLLSQLGNNIFSVTREGQYTSTLASHQTTTGSSSFVDVINFFTDFSSPDTFVYSWNKALPDATNSFLIERVVFYPGFASELFGFVDRNPNLGLSVVNILQPRGVINQKTYANIKGIALSKYSTNKFTAMLAMQTIASPYHSGQISKLLSLPPIYMSELRAKTDSSLAYLEVFQKAALQSVSFIDPDKTQTFSLFKELTESVLAGSTEIDGAYDRAETNLNFILSNLNQKMLNSQNSNSTGIVTDLNP